MKLLIADDDLTSRTILSAMTQEWGYTPISAEDGEVAWELIEEEEPLLLLLDWEMPRLHGLDLCKRIRKEKDGTPPYIIMLTAHDHIDDIVTGLENGANDYIPKPYNPLELKARLNVGRRMIDLQTELQEAKKQLEQLASKDELTGLYNRRSFNERYSSEWLHARRNQEPLSVAIIDIDFFKKFNDYYGHLNGDICLRSVAQTLLTTLQRPMDFLARYGGEEFAVILPKTTDPLKIMNDCRIAVEGLGIDHSMSSHKKVTVSIGCATLTPNMKKVDMDYLLGMADKELYKAKAAGRNKVSLVNIDEGGF